jgi:hypothetical protein
MEEKRNGKLLRALAEKITIIQLMLRRCRKNRCSITATLNRMSVLFIVAVKTAYFTSVTFSY